MAKLNTHLLNLEGRYLFPEIEKRKRACQRKDLLNLGIGDISLPLPSSIATALQQAAQEMTTESGKRGYGPEFGYDFLRQAIAEVEYEGKVSAEEVFVSEGITSDLSHIRELFSPTCRVGILSPTYPAYKDLATLLTPKENIFYIPCKEENGFIPKPPKEALDLIFFCNPNNPTGTVLSLTDWQEWIDYAKKNKTVLLCDGAYSAFVTTPGTPKSVYEVPGAREVAIELRSFSKSAGFTALRCGYMVIPEELEGDLGRIKPFWQRAQIAKCNGTSYPIQRGAEAALKGEGREQTKAQVGIYLESARILREGLRDMGMTFFGGVDSPYIFWKIKGNSWDYFDYLLQNCGIVSIPGSGFGKECESFVRLSAFIKEQTAREAIKRIRELYALQT